VFSIIIGAVLVVVIFAVIVIVILRTFNRQ